MIQAQTTPLAAEHPGIELRRVSKVYGSFVALRDVSFIVPPGSSVLLLGPNGAGKSTLLKVIAGLARPSYGEVLVAGQAPGSQAGRVAYLGHSTMLYDDLTALENLGYFYGLEQPATSEAQRRADISAALGEVGLDPSNQRRLSEYSQGMRQRAALARVLLASPEILLLDEPFSNLDLLSVQKMLTRLRGYLNEAQGDGLRRTLVLTTHQAEIARPLATSTLLLENGKLRASSATESDAVGQRHSRPEEQPV